MMPLANGGPAAPHDASHGSAWCVKPRQSDPTETFSLFKSNPKQELSTSRSDEWAKLCQSTKVGCRSYDIHNLKNNCTLPLPTQTAPRHTPRRTLLVLFKQPWHRASFESCLCRLASQELPFLPANRGYNLHRSSRRQPGCRLSLRSRFPRWSTSPTYVFACPEDTSHSST